ncbi:MAG: ABC transporter permease [Candidatus Poseidoniales archaeon]|nr:MAG: ABC transporter permease [Candidatus Poseidoniales archaeon]
MLLDLVRRTTSHCQNGRLGGAACSRLRHQRRWERMSKSGVRVRAIAKKELVEFVRDWRTILAILVIPLLMFPLLFILFPLLLASEAAELDALVVDVLVQGDDIPTDLGLMLNNSSLNITYEPLPTIEELSSPVGDEERLRNGTVDLILRLRMNESILEYAVLYQSTSEQSLEARSRTFDVLAGWEENETIRRISDAGLDPEQTLDPLQWDGEISQSDVATSGEQAGMALSLFIPLVLSVWTFSSAIQPSIDMTAGERERGTLEALLGLPCTRMELLLGKWLAVATITGVGVLLQVAGLLFAIGYLATSDIISTPSVSLTALLLLCLAVLLFAIMVVAFELALAMRSHSVKEAGSILGPAVLIILFPALFTQVINLDGIEAFWFAVPVVNVLLALRELLMNRIVFGHVVVWLVSSSLYALGAAYYAARQFKREDIVTSLS